MRETGTVLHVTATLDRAGTEVVCLGTVQGMAAKCVMSRVATMQKNSGAIVSALIPLVGEPVVLPETRRPRMVAFNRLLDELRPVGIVFHFFNLDHVLMSMLARLKGIRKIAVVQGNPAGTGSALRHKLRLILLASRVLRLPLISVSRYIEDSMARLGRLPARSRVIHNGCDTEAIAKRAAAASANANPNEMVILMVARLDPIKDHASLIRALALMPEIIRGRRVVLELAGEGVLRASLERLAVAEGVAGRVRFLGARSDIPERLGRATVFCLSTTRAEGFGVVLIEALSAGTPVVASDVPACAEVLDGGAFGKLAPPEDPQALALALIEILAGEGTEGPALSDVAAKYDIASMAQSYLDVLASQR